eukprot:Hpha_TRINITY_DN15596_c5_g3::TRINITY_DN15596_c5_g3_i1::g.105342::m.105342
MFIKIVGGPELLARVKEAGKDRAGHIAWSISNVNPIWDDPDPDHNQVHRLASKHCFNIEGGQWDEPPLIFLAADGKKIPGQRAIDVSKTPKEVGIKMGSQVWLEMVQGEPKAAAPKAAAPAAGDAKKKAETPKEEKAAKPKEEKKEEKKED